MRTDEPVPPSTPADQAVLRVQRARVRMVTDKESVRLSTGKGSSKPASQELQQEPLVIVSSGQSRDQKISGPRSTRAAQKRDGHQVVDTPPPERNTVLEGELGGAVVVELAEDAGARETKTREHVLSKDEEMALTILRQRERHNGAGKEAYSENIMSEGEEEEEEKDQNVEEEDVDDDDDDEEEEEEEEEEGHVYSYRSAPKSAEMARAPPERGSSSISRGSSSRGAKLEEDFVLPKDYLARNCSSSGSHSPSSSPPPSMGHVAPTRLSDVSSIIVY